MILSLKSFVIHLEERSTSKFVKAQTHMLILCYSTHTNLLMLNTYRILACSAPIATLTCSASIHYPISICDSTHIDHLVPKVTWYMYHAQHLKFTQHLLDFWLGTYYSLACVMYLASARKLVKYVDTQLSKPI